MFSTILSVFGPLLIPAVGKLLDAENASDAMKKQFYQFVLAYNAERSVPVTLHDSAQVQLDRLKQELATEKQGNAVPAP